MRSEGVAAASRELKRAIRAQTRFVEATNFEDAEDAYDAFLTHAGKIYSKLRAACHGQGIDWMWWKKIMNERRDDELLLYIHQSRNSETHRLEGLTRQLPAGEHRFALNSYGTILENCPRAHLSPLPVRDKGGIIYNPPCRHRQRFIGYMDVGTIIWLSSIYLQELVSEAASRLR